MAKKEVEFKTVVEGYVSKKSESTGVRISVVSIDGKEAIDLRQVYKKKDSEEWLHTSKGFTLPLETAQKTLKRFLKFVASLEEEEN